jgi:hypothetical protein
MPYKMNKKKNPLTIQQRKFIEHYLRTGNGTQSAIHAGYSRRSASAQANNLLNKNKSVMFEVEKARKKSEARAAYNYEVAMDECKEGMDLARTTENAGAFVNAVKIRSQLTGLLVEKHAIQAGFAIQISGITDVVEAVPQLVAADINILTGDVDEDE